MPAAPRLPNEDERLTALGALGILDTPRSPEFDIYPTLARSVFGTAAAALSLVDKDRQWFKSSIGLEMAETDRAQSLCAHAILKPGEVLCVPDATKDRRFADNPLVTGSFKLRFYAGAPIIGPSGHALGALCVLDSKPREASPAMLEFLRLLAVGAGTAVKLHASDRAARKAAVLESEARRLFTGTFTRTAAPVALVASSGAIVTSNPAFQQLVGYSTEELRSLNVEELTPPEHKEAARAARAKQLEDGERFELAFETFAKGGSRVPVRQTSALLQDGDQRMRVVTLMPTEPAAAGTPTPTPYARDVGELRAVSLEAFRELFGVKWERIAARALMEAEQIIRRRLSRDDVVSRVDEKFVIWFQSRDHDKNEETLTRIVRDIRIRFTTEFGAQAADHVSAALVPGGEAIAGSPKPTIVNTAPKTPIVNTAPAAPTPEAASRPARPAARAWEANRAMARAW